MGKVKNKKVKQIGFNLKYNFCIFIILLCLCCIGGGAAGIWMMMIWGCTDFMLAYCLGVLLIVLAFLIYCLQHRQGNVVNRFIEIFDSVVEMNERLIEKIKKF